MSSLPALKEFSLVQSGERKTLDNQFTKKKEWGGTNSEHGINSLSIFALNVKKNLQKCINIIKFKFK